MLVVGAGGLGCPALQYLVAAGIGTIGIVDADLVSITNLHRQVLYDMGDIGQLKVVSAERKLRALNDEVTIISYPVYIDTSNCIKLLEGYEIIIDCTDNFTSRYLLNDATALLGKPLVYGAVSQYEGQVAVFNTGDFGVNYRDIFPTPPAAGEVLNCAEAGVLGVLPGIIGTMQASETIKLITGIGETLVNRIFTFNLLTNQVYDIHIKPNPEAKAFLPQTIDAFEKIDYGWLCGEGSPEFEIDLIRFSQLVLDKNTRVIDVRELHEIPILDIAHERLPLSLLQTALDTKDEENIVFVCQSGKRSLEAAKWLKERDGKVKNIYSLAGGMLNYSRPTTEKDGNQKT